MGLHTFVRTTGVKTCTAVVGTDGMLLVGPGGPGDLTGLPEVPVLFTHRVPGGVDGAQSIAHDSEPADVTFSSVWASDLGGCYVEAVYPGRGPGTSSIVISVPGDAVVVAGDLVTQGGPPAYGRGSFPLEWPDTLDMVVGLTQAGSVVVPGRGDPVDRAFMQDQRQEIVGIAEQVNILAGNGVSELDAYDRGHWPPYPEQVMRVALARAFEQWTP